MRLAFCAMVLTVLAPVAFLASAAESPDFSTSGFKKRDGFFALQVDTARNRVYAQIPSPGKDGVALRMIHTAGLTAGLGSNPVGLDRGWWRDGEIMVFRKIGDKVILEVENQTYRASPENPLEQRAVKESFATSFVASAEILSEAGGLTIDLTDYLTSDSLNLVQYLKDAGQGSFSVAKDRTLVDTSNAFAFPDNVEIDAFFTLTSAKPDREVSTTTANGKDVTLVQHHSFVRLPEEGYTPLASDPRTGAIDIAYFDYSAALDEPIEKRLARRFRLQKDTSGKTVKPITVYIDPGAPEPIRSALVDGAKWWADAFAAAGYADGYKVELLPEDAHPLDIRYNVVQWVHRQTRGWSYGGGVSDPRTGEMLKGHVILGSLRVRQDRMIFEGLAGTSETGSGNANDPVELALSRIRQLSAHEIGHSLGFEHNFAASTYGKGSVMDYPAPDIRVTDGELDFSNAYGVGVGSWDKFAATWLYGDLTPEARDDLVQTALGDGLVYVADADARSPSTAHPLGNIWDNGADPVAALNESLDVRRIALENFGPDRIAQGQPVAALKSVIVPIYLYHRYQTAAAAKVIGGMTFNYGLRGDGQPASAPVAADQQRAALKAVLNTVSASELYMPDRIAALLTPANDSYLMADTNRELFNRTSYPAFDVVSAADTAASMTFDILLDPQRIARLVEFHRRDTEQLGAEEAFKTIRQSVMSGNVSDRQKPITEAVRARYAYSLMKLSDAETSTAVKSAAFSALMDLKTALKRDGSAHSVWLETRIDAFEDRPAEAAPVVVKAKDLPPGGPIGMNAYETCWFCD